MREQFQFVLWYQTFQISTLYIKLIYIKLQKQSTFVIKKKYQMGKQFNPQNHKFKLPGYHIFQNRRLGYGAFSEVYVGIKDGDSTQYAIKIIQLGKCGLKHNQEIQFIQEKEVRPFKQLNHQHIVQVYHYDYNQHYFFIVQQKCDYDLKALIDAKNHMNIKFNDNHCFYILFQICQAFKYLSSKCIIHRDLKPANIMVRNGIIKIADFGLIGKNQDKATKLMSNVGTSLYKPPQLLESISGKSLYNQKFDVWALGCIGYELSFGDLPWSYCNQQTRKIIFNSYKLMMNIQQIQSMKIDKKTSSFQIRKFLNCTLTIDDKKRKNWEQLLSILDQEKKQDLFKLSQPFKIYFNKIVDDYYEKTHPKQQNQNLQEQMNKVIVKKTFSSNLSKIPNIDKTIQKSSILNKDDFQVLIFWLQKPVKNVQLKYKASQNQYSMGKYYQSCGHLSNTLIVIKTQKNKIIGGYTPLSFNPVSVYLQDDQSVEDQSYTSFLFSLSLIQKFPINQNQDAIERKIKKDSIFFNYTLRVQNNSNEQKNNYFYLGRDYYNTSKYQDDKYSYLKITGNESAWFIAEQWEVYHIQFQ